MSSAFSDYCEYTILRQMLSQTDSANLVATAVWIGLHQGTLTDTGGTSGAEVSTTGGYARVSLGSTGFVLTTSGTVVAKNGTAITFAQNTLGSAYIVECVGIWRHSSSNASSALLYRGTVSAATTVNLNDTFEFAASALTVTIS